MAIPFALYKLSSTGDRPNNSFKSARFAALAETHPSRTGRLNSGVRPQVEFATGIGLVHRCLAGESQRLATYFGQCNPDCSASGLGGLP